MLNSDSISGLSSVGVNPESLAMEGVRQDGGARHNMTPSTLDVRSPLHACVKH